ncbi:MAG TPA: D-glycerate dehydrogenase [Candidatus Limnocylindrales bacterium]|nr:D-glycerate dehydrogenase [Candidatus Limnocylindrales bacterium]
MIGSHKVFVARAIPEPGLTPVREATDADVWTDELPPSREILLRRVKGIDGLLSLLTDRVDEELLEAAGPQLKVVSNFAVGFDNIDVPACTRRGIPVGNTPGVLTETTADLAFALLMAAARRLPEGYDYVRAGRWRTWGPMLLLGHDIYGATLGIVGFGRIGREMARRASGFGMRVLYYDVHPASAEDEQRLNATGVAMDRLLAESDFISLHTNLTDETRHLLDVDAFAQMKPSAIVINTSRGPVIDHDALFEALRDGVIAAAALDVTDPEPLPDDHPLWTLDDVIITGHTANTWRMAVPELARLVEENVRRFAAGESLLGVVDPDLQY